MKKRRILALVLCVALMFALVRPITGSAETPTDPTDPSAPSTDEIARQMDELLRREQELVEQMKALEAKLTENATEIEAAVARKNVLDQQINLLHEQILNTDNQISACRVMIADKQEELNAAEVVQKALLDKHKERIRAMEERGELSYWSILFHANDFSDFLDRMNMIQQIAAADKRHLDDLRKASAKVNAAKQELQLRQEEMEEARLQQEQAKAELNEKRKEADALLQELVEKENEYKALLARSEQMQDDLMRQLAQKQSEYDDAAYQDWMATSTPGQSGGDPPPTREGWLSPLTSYTLTSPFGMRFHPVLGVYRMHNGVDMAAPANTPIYAARSGTVTVASYQEEGAGYYVQIAHGDGYRSIYMHMTRYIVYSGQDVTVGQVIGYVGSTGVSTGNHLHFGISYNGTYVNPMQFIS